MPKLKPEDVAKLGGTKLREAVKAKEAAASQGSGLIALDSKGRPRCTAKSKTTGVQCGRPSLKDRNVCQFHGGRIPAVVAAAERRGMARRAEKLLAGMNRHIDDHIVINPLDELLHQITQAAYFERILHEQVDQARALTYSSDTEVGYSEDIAAIVKLWNDERKRLVDWCEKALKIGIDERRVKMAEIQGVHLWEAIVGGLRDANLTPEQQETVQRAIGRRLRDVLQPARIPG